MPDKREVIELDLPEKEYRVAIVVFALAAGFDAHDAANRVESTLHRIIHNSDDSTLADGYWEVPLMHSYDKIVNGRTAKIVEIAELGTAAGNGYLWTEPTRKAYRWKGLEGDGE